MFYDAGRVKVGLGRLGVPVKLGESESERPFPSECVVCVVVTHIKLNTIFLR